MKKDPLDLPITPGDGQDRSRAIIAGILGIGLAVAVAAEFSFWEDTAVSSKQVTEEPTKQALSTPVVIRYENGTTCTLGVSGYKCVGRPSDVQIRLRSSKYIKCGNGVTGGNGCGYDIGAMLRDTRDKRRKKDQQP